MKTLSVKAFAIIASFLLIVSVSSAKHVCTVGSGGGNSGHCEALSSGNGDMCFNENVAGNGPACNGDVEVKAARIE